jgi:hypothetical protein
MTDAMAVHNWLSTGRSIGLGPHSTRLLVRDHTETFLFGGAPLTQIWMAIRTSLRPKRTGSGDSKQGNELRK